MSDPAVEAVKRVKHPAWAFIHPLGAVEDIAELAVREALAPLRELHQRQHGICVECWWSDGTPMDWPCATARLIYPSEELT